MSFELYATGNYSDNQIAIELNNHNFLTTQGRMFSTATVRDMLQNRTYTGFVRYSQHILKSDGRRSLNEPVEWIKAKHDALIPIALFETCQEVRKSRVKHHDYHPVNRTFLLNGICYCYSCMQNEPAHETSKSYGKMRTQASGRTHAQADRYAYHICRAKEFGVSCPQVAVRTDFVEQEVIDFLMTLKPPADWRETILKAVSQVIGNKQLEQRMGEIREIIMRMDFRWDNGFIADKNEYVEQRLKLQQELEELTPIPTNEIELAADILDNFPSHWQATNGDKKAQRELIQTVVERVYIDGKHVIALVLKPSFFCSLGGVAGYTGTPTESNEKPSDTTSSEGLAPVREGQDSNLRSGITRKTA